MKFGIFENGKLIKEFGTEEEAIANGRWEDIYPILTPGQWLDYQGGKWSINGELFIRYESIFGTCISPRAGERNKQIKGKRRPEAITRITCVGLTYDEAYQCCGFSLFRD